MKKLLAIIGILGMLGTSSLSAANGTGFQTVWSSIFKPFVDVTKSTLQLAIPTPESRICTFVNVDHENVETEKILNAPYNPSSSYNSSWESFGSQFK
jgi:hypothetical protein